jgi:hypothetical protein
MTSLCSYDLPSKELWSQGYIRDSVLALSRLIDILQRIKAFDTQESTETQRLTASQVKSTLFMARVGLARILACFKEYTAQVIELYVSAVNDNWDLHLDPHQQVSLVQRLFPNHSTKIADGVAFFKASWTIVGPVQGCL